MALRALSLLLISVLTLSGCDDNNEPDPIRMFLPSGATSIEVVDGQIFYVHLHKLYRSTLEGNTTLVDEDYLDFPAQNKPQIFGLKSQVVSYNKTYQSASDTSKNKFSIKGLNGLSNQDTIYAIKDNKIIAIDDSNNYVEVDISHALTSLSDDITMHTAIVDGDDLIISYSLADNDNIQSALIIDGILHETYTNGEFVSVIKSENRETLFIQFKQSAIEFNYRTNTMVTIMSPSILTYTFTVDDIVYSSSADLLTYRYDYRNNFSEPYSFSEQLGQVRDVETVNGVHYAATENGVWVINDELEPVKQIVKL